MTKPQTKLSVNINKIATLRNSRGGSNPDVLKWALDIEKMGAHGITVHPRPDERHIKYDDVRALSQSLTKEFNIEGNPEEDKFIKLVLEAAPAQVTLVPDDINQLTSNHGWDTIAHHQKLKDFISLFKANGIRVSIFVDPIEEMIYAAKECGTDRIELYTEAYAAQFHIDKNAAVSPYVKCAQIASDIGLEVNAGHDLDLQNLSFLRQQLPILHEVSIGHALVADALRFGMDNTVNMYLRALDTYYE